MDEQQKAPEPPISGYAPVETPYLGDCVAKTSSYKGRLREINITPLNTGFVVRLGCQTLAISDKKKLLEELVKYFNNPAEVEARYFAGEFGETNEI